MSTDQSRYEFQTHWNYIRAFEALSPTHGIFGSEDRRETLNQCIDAVLGNQPPRLPLKAVDQQIERCLRMAWSTRTLLEQQTKLCEQSPDLSRSIAVWATIQAYYACYHSIQAMVMATGQTRPPHHSKTQKQFDRIWTGEIRNQTPWSLGYGIDGPSNFPVEIQTVSNIATFDLRNSFSLVGMALRTTWEDEFKQSLSKESLQAQRSRVRTWRLEQSSASRQLKSPQWLAAKRKRLSATERDAIGRKLGNSTLLSYLSRLRMRANYLGPDMFIDGPIDDSSCTHFVETLHKLAESTILVHERLVAHHIGSNMVEEMRNRNRPNA